MTSGIFEKLILPFVGFAGIFKRVAPQNGSTIATGRDRTDGAETH
jgi:hypothetical protein